MENHLSFGKITGLRACTNMSGIFSAVAIDHCHTICSTLSNQINISPAELSCQLGQIKQIIVKQLSPDASAVLLDPVYGLSAARQRFPYTGLLLAYETPSYDPSLPGRQPRLLGHWSVARLVQAGAQAIKIMLDYYPDDESVINNMKHAFVERVGAECTACDVPFLLEPMIYTPTDDMHSLTFARRKPELVMRAVTEFSQPQYQVDILKIEFPISPNWTTGVAGFAGGAVAYTRTEAHAYFQALAAVATCPLVFLSAGLCIEVFVDLLVLAGESKIPFSGVLCGRSLWQEGLDAYTQLGQPALEYWLATIGRSRLARINQLLEQIATPWYECYDSVDSEVECEATAELHQGD